jgi:hypothetical protein
MLIKQLWDWMFAGTKELILYSEFKNKNRFQYGKSNNCRVSQERIINLNQ